MRESGTHLAIVEDMGELDGVLPANERARLCEAYGRLNCCERDLDECAGNVGALDCGSRRVGERAGCLGCEIRFVNTGKREERGRKTGKLRERNSRA